MSTFLFCGQERATWAFVTKKRQNMCNFCTFSTSQLHRRVQTSKFLVFSVGHTDRFSSDLQTYLVLAFKMLRVTLQRTHYAVWLQCGVKTAQHALLLSSNLHELGFTGITSYQKLTCMLLFCLYRETSVKLRVVGWGQGIRPRCCQKSSSVCIHIILAASSLALFCLLLPAVPLVLTVNQICLLPSREPYFFASWPYPLKKEISLRWSIFFYF